MEKEILTEPEAAELMGYKISTIRNYRIRIPHYVSPLGRVYYKKSELISWMLSTKIDTSTTIKERQ